MKVSRSANFTGLNKPSATSLSRTTNYSPGIARKPSRSDVKVLYVDNEFSNEEIAESESNNGGGKDLFHVEKDIEQLLCSLSHIKAFIGRRAEISDQISIDQSQTSAQEPCLCVNHSTIHFGQILEESLYEEPLNIPTFSTPPQEHYVVNEGHVANVAFALESSDRFECVLSRQSFANGDDDNGDIIWTICGDESNNYTAPNQSDLKVVFNRANPDPKSCSLNCLIFDVKPSYTGMYRVEAINIKGASVTAPFVLEVIDSQDNTYRRPMFRNCLIYTGDGPASSSYEIHLDLWPCLPTPSLFLFKDGLRLDHSTSSIGRFPTYPSIMEFATSNDQIKGVGPNQTTSSTQSIMRTSVFLNSTHTSQFSGMYLCLAENRVGKGLTTFELDPTYTDREKEPSLQLMPLSQPSALVSPQSPALSSDQWWETEPLELEVGVKESVITRLLVVADQPMESLSEALNKEMPSSMDRTFQSLEDHDIPTYNDENRNTPIKVDHHRYIYKRPTPSEHNKDSSTTTEDEINSSSTSNSYDEWTCSNPTSVAYRTPVKRNYYFYSSSRVEKSEISPRDVPLDSPYHPSDDQWGRRCESSGYTDIGQVHESDVNDSDSTTSSLPTISETANHQHGQSGVRTETPEPSKSLTMQTLERTTGGEEDNNGVEEGIKVYKRDAKNVIFMSCNTTRGTSPKLNSPVRTTTPEQSQPGKGQAISTTPSSASSKFKKTRSLFEAKPNVGPTENSPVVPSKVHTRAQHNSVKWRQPPLVPVSCSSTSTALLHKYGPHNSKPSSPLRVVDRSVVDSHDAKRTGTRYYDSKANSPNNLTPPPNNCTRLDGAFSPLHSSASHYSDPLPNNQPLPTRIRYKNVGSSSPWPRRRFTTEVETVPACDSRSETPVQHCRVIQYSSAADLSRDQHS